MKARSLLAAALILSACDQTSSQQAQELAVPSATLTDLLEAASMAHESCGHLRRDVDEALRNRDITWFEADLNHRPADIKAAFDAVANVYPRQNEVARLAPCALEAIEITSAARHAFAAAPSAHYFELAKQRANSLSLECAEAIKNRGQIPPGSPQLGEFNPPQ